MLFTGWCSTTPTLLRTYFCHLVGKMVIQKAHECSSCYARLSVFHWCHNPTFDHLLGRPFQLVSSSYPPLAIWKGSHNSSFGGGLTNHSCDCGILSPIRSSGWTFVNNPFVHVGQISRFRTLSPKRLWLELPLPDADAPICDGFNPQVIAGVPY